MFDPENVERWLDDRFGSEVVDAADYDRLLSQFRIRGLFIAEVREQGEQDKYGGCPDCHDNDGLVNGQQDCTNLMHNRLMDLAAAVYQIAGANLMPLRIMDVLSTIQRGAWDEPSKMLPYYPSENGKGWTGIEQSPSPAPELPPLTGKLDKDDEMRDKRDELQEFWDTALSQSVGIRYNYETKTIVNERAEELQRTIAEKDAQIAKLEKDREIPWTDK